MGNKNNFIFQETWICTWQWDDTGTSRQTRNWRFYDKVIKMPGLEEITLRKGGEEKNEIEEGTSQGHLYQGWKWK